MSDEQPDWWTSDEWETPPEIVDEEEERGGRFTLDACCRPATAKADEYYTGEDDGLAQQWTGRVWCNPPYSNPAPWVIKAVESVRDGDAREVVMLLPAATDTGWFHDLVLPYADVHFRRGRIKFLGWDGKPRGTPKAGSIIAYFPKRVHA